MAEWSKALDSSSSLFGGVGSNPTSTTFYLQFSELRHGLPFATILREPPSIYTRIEIGPSRLAQLVERKTLNLVVVGSSPTVGVLFGVHF